MTPIEILRQVVQEVGLRVGFPLGLIGRVPTSIMFDIDPEVTPRQIYPMSYEIVRDKPYFKTAHPTKPDP